MMSQTPNDGGPAFPSGDYIDGYRQDGSPVHLARHEGMSLRDYFAAKAMAAILTHLDAFENAGETSVARMAYNQADAMFEIRAEHDEAVAIAEQRAGGVQ